jgi:hypothetical protein
MYKFHHNKIVNIISNVAVYSAVSLIVTCSLTILVALVNGNIPTSFGIYG